MSFDFLEWETKAQTTRKGFEDMSTTAKQEMMQWESERVQVNFFIFVFKIIFKFLFNFI